MNIKFDFNIPITIEFGIGRKGKDKAFFFVPVDRRVQEILVEMVKTTIRKMYEISEEPKCYAPSEKYGSCESIYIPLNDAMSELAKLIHDAKNLETDNKPLSNTDNIFCYFTRFTNEKNQRLTAVRRANQFKVVLKSHLIQFTSDALTVIPNKVFKLDSDFDFLIDDDNVHILHTCGFEFICELQQVLMSAAPQNIKEMQQDLDFIDFSVIEEYVSEHSRAARYLASIRVSGETNNISMQNLVKLCESTGVNITFDGEKIQVGKDSIIGFLEVLDRRRYQIELVNGSPERYKAPSREKLKDHTNN